MATKAEIPPPSLADDPDWDRVDQAAWESFPASDPPSFSSGRAVPSAVSVADTSDLVACQLRRLKRRARIQRGMRLGLGVLGAWLLWTVARATR